jgi:Rieske Fe-S protein
LASKSASSEDDKPGSDERPQNGYLLEHQGAVFEPDDLKLGGPPVRAWPKDSKTSVVSNGSRLNEILVIRLDPGELDEETRRRCADGIVAHSGVCSDVGRSATGCWSKAEQSDKDIHKGFCYNFEFNPRERAQVAFGPALRRLAAPLAIADGSLTVAATFVGKVGAQQPGR